MGDGEHGAGVGGEVLLEPRHGLGVEVVGRLVEEQEVGLAQEQLAQGDAATLTTGEHRDVGVRRRAAQGVHRLLELGVQIPRVGVVDLLLKGAHLGHQLVEVGVGLGHLGGDLVEPVDLGLDLAEALLDIAEHGLGLVQRGLLEQDADAVTRGEARLSVRGLVEPRHDLEDLARLGHGVDELGHEPKAIPPACPDRIGPAASQPACA